MNNEKQLREKLLGQKIASFKPLNLLKNDTP